LLRRPAAGAAASVTAEAKLHSDAVTAGTLICQRALPYFEPVLRHCGLAQSTAPWPPYTPAQAALHQPHILH
jgi:hypothetical protein